MMAENSFGQKSALDNFSINSIREVELLELYLAVSG
jgi:hypothetical protein